MPDANPYPYNQSPQLVAGVNELGEIQTIGINSASGGIAGSSESLILNPDWSRFGFEPLVEVTNEVDGTRYYPVDMAGYSRLDAMLIIDGGSGGATGMTVTTEGSLIDDGTSASAVTYIANTLAAYGASNFQASALLIDTAGYWGGVKYARFKTVSSTGGANDADITIWIRRSY